MIQLDNAVEHYKNIILNELKDEKITCWIAGGCLRDYFMAVPIKTDIDIFFPNIFNQNKCAEYFKAKGGEVIWESDNGMKIKYNGRKYDLVKKYFADPQATIDVFDFTVSMFACDSEKIYHGESSFIDLAKRQLMINKITYPASTMSRAFRYYQKGFRMCLGEMAKMVEAIQDMPKVIKQEQPDNTDEPPSGDRDSIFIGLD